MISLNSYGKCALLLLHYSKKEKKTFLLRSIFDNSFFFCIDGDRDVLKENTDNNNNKRHTQEVMSSHSFTRVKGSWEVKTSSAKTKVPSHDSSTLPPKAR